jgi:hypothetical protein
VTELPEITDEDCQVAEEAHEVWVKMLSDDRITAAAIAAALVRTGWKPVDPDLILAREVCAELWISEGSPTTAEVYRRGDNDNHHIVRIALAAIKAADARRKGA